MTFNEFYDKHFYEVVRHLSKQLMNEEEAKDLAQNIFIKILVNWDKIDPSKGSYRTYLFRVVSNMLSDHFRHIKRKYAPGHAVSLADEGIETGIDLNSNTDTDERAIRNDYAKNFKKILDTLPIKQKRIVLLHVHGFKMREISEKLRIPTGSVTAYINQLHKKFHNKRYLVAAINS